MTEDESQSVSLMPKQYKFVMSDAKQVLYSGAFGAGKSRALCFRAMRLALVSPAARVGLCRKTFVSLKSTTLRTLIEPDGDLPPVLAPGTYHYHKVPGEEKIKLQGAGEILLFGCDNHLKIGSMQMSDVCVDECVELDQDEWNMLLGRIRVSFTVNHETGERNKQTISGACNPSHPGHFLHRLFYEDVTDDSDRELIETTTIENWHLPQGYVESMISTYTGPALERYIYGKWAVTEGAVYPMYDPKTHVVHRTGPWLRYVAGVDYGFSNPMAMRVHGVDGDGASHVVSEYHRAGIHVDDFVKICLSTAEHYKPITFVCDPSAPALISAMRRAGLSVMKANNDVFAGICEVQNVLSGTTGLGPRLTFEPGCKAGNLEYLSYAWKDSDSKDEPVKTHDHACDADRYAVMFINAPSRGRRLRSLQLSRPSQRSFRERSIQDEWCEVGTGTGGEWN